jgi:branched-subunit amino acid ABC-type transport system permease component
MDTVQYLLLGLGAGAVIAALALGVLLTYRASGVVNFAHAALGMYLAYTYISLRQRGELLIPVVGLPGRVQLFPSDVKPSWATAFAMTMVIGALIGLVVYWLVFRPLRQAPALAKVVASLGLFLYLLGITNQRLGSQGSSLGKPPPILPAKVVDLLGVQIPADRLWLLGLVVVATAVLAAVFHYTRFGLATRAAAESEKGAVLLGHSPDRLAALNWMAASMLAGAAVILIAPISGLDPGTTSLLITPALAAALLGGFRSFTLTTLAGLGIGMLQSEILNLRGDLAWLPDLDWQAALPLIIIVAIMAVRGERIPSRGALREGRFPLSPAPRHLTWWALGGSAVVLVGLFTLDSSWRQGLIVSMVTAVIALSIVLLTGYVGQISLMPMALAGVSAFAMIKLTVSFHVPFPVAPLLAALIATALGLVIGLPAVRVRGINLAIATLAAATVVEELVLKWSWFSGGLAGASVPRPRLFGLDLGIGAAGSAFPRPAFGVVCLVVLVGSAVGVANLRRGATGLRWLGVRANERAASGAAIDVRRTKLVAFALSSFLAGLGGTLLAYQYDTLSVNSFTVFASLALVATTYLGGIASIAGALVAGIVADGGVLTALIGAKSSASTYAVNGLMLMVVVVVYPDGLVAGVRSAVTWLRTRRSPARRSAPAPSPASG